jgi:choline transport protein
MGCLLTASRVFWTLARDNATPFSGFFATVNKKHRNPFNSIVLCTVIASLLDCIYVGSQTAFNAFIGSFVVLSSLSYLAAILPHFLSRRANVAPGWFWMKGASGFLVNGIASLYIIAFVVIFCFPFSMPVNAESMNYTSLITGAFRSLWEFSGSGGKGIMWDRTLSPWRVQFWQKMLSESLAILSVDISVPN